MRLDRRWWVAIAVAVVAIGALLVNHFVFQRTSAECKPVREMLDFNSAQGAQIAAKTADDKGIPTVAEDAAYQQWADGLAERAQRVTDPALASHAVDLADLANQFVGKLPLVRAESAARAPGAPAPPVVYEMSVLDSRIADETAQLAKACPK